VSQCAEGEAQNAGSRAAANKLGKHIAGRERGEEGPLHASRT